MGEKERDEERESRIEEKNELKTGVQKSIPYL